MKSILRWLTALGLLALALSGCGGGSHHSTPRQRAHAITTLEKVVQPHSPVEAGPIPQPGQRMPAAVVPVPPPTKARAAAHAKRAAVVSRVAAKAPAHVAGARVRLAGDVTAATVEQFDSVTVSTVPSWAHYTAGYVDGSWRTYFQLKARGFPVVVGISVSTRDGADCFDMEPGNPGPSNAGPWAASQMAQGNTRPCEYSMLSWMPAIKQNLASHGISVCTSATQDRCVRLWDANWTYVQHLDSGYACTQWTDRAFGLNLDESTCATWFYSITRPVDPYRGYPKTRWLLKGGVLASEYYTVKTWDTFRCRVPVRRPTCKSTYYHLELLRDRTYFVATHVVKAGRWTALSKPRWSFPTGQPLGSRFAGISHRLEQR